MFSAFVNRRPWVAAVIAFFLTPVVGMLYLGRGLWAIAYLLAGAWVFVLPLLAAHFQLLPVSIWVGIALLGAVYGLAGSLHCFLLAGRRGGTRSDEWFLLPYALLAIPLFLALVPKLLWEPYNIPSSSMEPTLHVGDYLFVSKHIYRFTEPRRGDLVIFVAPTGGTTAYVHRLVGLPGDRIQMKAGSLYLNEERLRREEVEGAADQDARGPGEIYRETLPEGRSYLIREMSDSGFLDNTEVYEVPGGHYFFLGDNRDNSMDSRTMLGTVPRENLLGRLAVVVWNMQSFRLRLFDAVD